MTSSDLQVNSISESLLGKSIDVVITGSIGSVEAVRFAFTSTIRSRCSSLAFQGAKF